MTRHALILALALSVSCMAQRPASKTHVAQTSSSANKTPVIVESAEQLRERLLAAIGGQADWAKASGYHVHATHYLADQSTSFANRIWLDFTAPRVRIESDMGADRPMSRCLEQAG
jgi:hypothetical protein